MFVDDWIRFHPVIELGRKEDRMHQGDRKNSLIFKNNRGKHLRVKVNMLKFTVRCVIQIKRMNYIGE